MPLQSVINNRFNEWLESIEILIVTPNVIVPNLCIWIDLAENIKAGYDGTPIFISKRDLKRVLNGPRSRT